MMVGFQPDEALMADPPFAGSVQVMTGKATATSPLTGTVVGALPPAPPPPLPPPGIEVEVTPVEAVVPSNDVPQPVSSERPAMQSNGRCPGVCRRPANGGRSTVGIDVIGQTIGPHGLAPVGNRSRQPKSAIKGGNRYRSRRWVRYRQAQGPARPCGAGRPDRRDQ